MGEAYRIWCIYHLVADSKSTSLFRSLPRLLDFLRSQVLEISLVIHLFLLKKHDEHFSFQSPFLKNF